MFVYVVRRILYVIPIALGMSILCFSLVHLAPGDPLSAVVAPDAPKEAVAALKKAYGFDKPLPLQYLVWLSRTLTGNLGVSIATHRSVSEQILLRNGAVCSTSCKIRSGKCRGCLPCREPVSFHFTQL